MTLLINIIILSLFSHSAFSAEHTVINQANTVWVLISTALVMFMTPGLALFYGGMVNKKHTIATIMHSYMKLCVITLIWVLVGYTIAFGDSVNGLFGNFKYIGFNNLIGDILDDIAIPHILFALFQGMFAVLTAAIITGSFAERVRPRSALLFTAIWTIIVYAPIAHWIWGSGWIAEIFSPLDFAGGTVVHINSAIAGLVAALFIGKRVEYKPHIEAHNIPVTILGASILWFGWFGFNAGSSLMADELATIAFANTCIAGAAGGISWYIVEIIKSGKSSAIGTISGSIVGLVAITPAAGFVSPLSSIFIGLLGSPICFWAVSVLKPKLGYDDSLDVFGIHGIGGIWGAIATGIFASTAINPDGLNGLIHGNPNLLTSQIFSTIIIIIYSAIMTYIILYVINNYIIKLRVSTKEEKRGLDNTIHGEEILS